jgi:hypothetical protein
MSDEVTDRMELKPGDILVVGPGGKFVVLPNSEKTGLAVDVEKTISLHAPYSRETAVSRAAAQLVDAVWEDMFYDTGEMK